MDSSRKATKFPRPTPTSEFQPVHARISCVSQKRRDEAAGEAPVAHPMTSAEREEKKAELPSGAKAPDTPTRSETQSEGPKGRSAMRSVALDLGNKISYCEVSGGEVVRRATVRELSQLVRWLGPQTAPAKVAIEACREAWFVEARLREWGQQPIVVDTTRCRQLGIGQHKRKTDRIDAEVLARATERGTLPVAHVLSPHRQALRLQLSVRRALVETRAQYITTIRGLARAQGFRIPKCCSEDFLRAVQRVQLNECTRELIAPLAAMIGELEKGIIETENKLEFLCAQEPTVMRLRTVPGVGTIISAAFVSVVDDAKRFQTAHQVESYLGVVPSENTSVHRRLGAVTKHGNSYLRSLLVQAAWTILRRRDPQDPLCRWGQAVAARRGKRIAIVALSRRLVGVLWAMWRDGTVYEKGRLGLASAGGLQLQAQSLQVQAAEMARAARKRPSSSKLLASARLRGGAN